MKDPEVGALCSPYPNPSPTPSPNPNPIPNPNPNPNPGRRAVHVLTLWGDARRHARLVQLAHAAAVEIYGDIRRYTGI